MGDCLDNLKKRYYMCNLAYWNPNGVSKMGEVRSGTVDAFIALYEHIDGDMLDRLRVGIAGLTYLNDDHYDKEKEWCSIDEWVETCSWFLFKRPRVFRKRWHYWFASVFDVLDVDRDGYINEAEFSNFYQITCRKEDRDWITRAFKVIDVNKSGRLSREQYVDTYVRYFSDPDVTYDDLPLY